MPKSRSPVLGYNHNIRHKGWVFHVQTEDSGILSPHIFTHLFHEGVIIASKKLEYDPESDDDIVKGLMQAQHKSVMKELARGAYDAKIDVYLGPAPEEADAAIPQDLPDDAGATIPTPPPEDVIELDDGSSAPYAQVVLEDDSQALVSGTLDVVSERIALMDDDTDDEINGLLNRLREETPAPIIEPAAPLSVPPVPESPGTWIVARPGQKERPFDRSGPIPIPIRDDANRRVLTPPQFEVPAVTRPVSPSAPQRAVTPPPAARPPTQPPVARRSTGRSLTPPAVVPPRTAQPASSPPTRPLPPVAARSGGPPGPPPALPRPQAPPAATPVLPRGAGAAVRPPPVPSSSTNQAVPPRTTAPMATQRTPAVPPTAPRQPQQTAPFGQRPVPGPPSPTGSGFVPGSPGAIPRRAPTQESVVVARPAVVIGAPPTVIGTPEPTQRRPHGRETGESLFGQDLITEKSLDEVIMAYLSEESNED